MALERISDLLFWLPSRYEDRRQVSSVADLEVGMPQRDIHRPGSSMIVDCRSNTSRAGASIKILQVYGRRRRRRGASRSSGFAVARGARSPASSSRACRLLVTGDVKRYRFTKEIMHPDDRGPRRRRVCRSRGRGSHRCRALRRLRRVEQDAEREDMRSVVPSLPRAPKGINPAHPAATRWARRPLTQYSDLASPGYLPVECGGGATSSAFRPRLHC